MINYGIVYGMGPWSGAARELGVDVAEAYIAGYFARYPGVRRFVDGTIATARERGYVTTVLGRRRYLPELGSRDSAVRQFAERAATNTPIQGSAADLIKLAMLEVRRRLGAAGLRTRMLLQVHDELVLEAPEAEVSRSMALVREAMEGIWPLRVPLRVDVLGANGPGPWLENRPVAEYPGPRASDKANVPWASDGELVQRARKATEMLSGVGRAPPAQDRHARARCYEPR